MVETLNLYHQQLSSMQYYIINQSYHAVLCSVAQSRLTPGDPMGCSLPGSSVHGIFPGKNTGVGCHFLLQTFGSNTHALCLLVDSLPLSHQGSPILYFRDSNSFPLVPKEFFFYSILYHNELTSPPDHVFLGGGVLLISVSPPIFRSISTHESYLNPQINPIESCFMFICISHST